jgi:hypothetical protein
MVETPNTGRRGSAALNRTIRWISKHQILLGAEPHHHWCSSARSVGLDRTIGWGSKARILNGCLRHDHEAGHDITQPGYRGR